MRKLVLLALLPLLFTVNAMAGYACGLYEDLSMEENYWANNPNDPVYKVQETYTKGSGHEMLGVEGIPCIWYKNN